MYYVIRRSVFETNSSSTHTITIAGGGEYQKDQIVCRDDDGVCRIYPGEYGWEVVTYLDAATKASYALTWAKQSETPGALDMLRKVIEEEVGANVVFVPSDDEYHEWGYIDHQSADVCAPAFQSPQTLRDFIFNPQSVLKTDNDNH